MSCPGFMFLSLYYGTCWQAFPTLHPGRKLPEEVILMITYDAPDDVANIPDYRGIWTYR